MDYDTIRAIEWRDDRLWLLDQRVLPERSERLEFTRAADVATAIREMVVRGAPAIGVTAAYAVVLAARERFASNPGGWKQDIEEDLAVLAKSRPTAVNLRWAIGRMRQCVAALDGPPAEGLLAEAERIHAEDIAANRTMGRLGAEFIDEGSNVLTHCNAGALATGGYGTALGVIRAAHADGRIDTVFADETRPWLQGSRLTAWELVRDGIPVQLIADGAAAYAMAQGKVRWVIVGADRVAANGDVANKIGTYSLALSARHHGVGFMVVAPCSTLDLGVRDGSEIPIEQRAKAELLSIADKRMAPTDADVWNPVFDVTPAELVDVLVTERGAVSKPTTQKIAELMAVQ